MAKLLVGFSVGIAALFLLSNAIGSGELLVLAIAAFALGLLWLGFATSGLWRWMSWVSFAFIGLACSAFAGMFSGTDVRFQSSNGEWARPELRFKGEHFMEVATVFEAYRVKCWPSAVLQRTTLPPSWHEREHWFNDYSQRKWKVPYASPVHADSRYPRNAIPDAKVCASQVLQESELKAARERAMRLYGEGS